MKRAPAAKAGATPRAANRPAPGIDVEAATKVVLTSLEDDKAEEILAIDIRGKSSFADMLVIDEILRDFPPGHFNLLLRKKRKSQRGERPYQACKTWFHGQSLTSATLIGNRQYHSRVGRLRFVPLPSGAPGAVAKSAL